MSLKEDTYKNIKNRIITNELKAGQQLYEKELMKEYSIGRTPLREIFHDLQRDGLIEILPKLGTKVVSLDLKVLKETIQLRRELEGLAAKLATRKINAEQLALFEDYLKQAEAISDHDPDAEKELARIDVSIHNMIYRIADNEQLSHIIKILLDKMTMYWFQSGCTVSEFREEMDEFRALYKAMIRGDANEARQIMKGHIDHFAKLITSHMF